MQNYCRLCTAQNCRLSNFYEYHNVEKFTKLLKLKKDDGLPQHVCEACLTKVKDINSFVETCVKSYEYFNNLHSKPKEDFKDDFKDDLSDDDDFKLEPSGNSNDSTESHGDAIDCLPFIEKDEDDLVEIKTEIKEETIIDQDVGKNFYIENKNTVIETKNKKTTNEIVNKNKKKSEKKRRKNETEDITTTEWKCEFCPRAFSTEKILRRHMQNIHTNPNYKCIKCGFECTNRSNCAGHVKRKHFKDLNMEFEELLQFVLEKDSETNDANFSDLPFPCKECTRSFAKESELQKHKNRVHISDPDSVKLFGCKKCGSKYTYRKTAVKHIRNVHYERRTELVKAEIDEFLIQFGDPKPELDDMKPSKENKEEEKTVHECPVCHLKYARAIILKSHFARFHLSEDEKKKRKKKVYLCQQCGKNFSARSAFKYHVQTHFGDKEFKCTECPKAYYTKHLLLSHMRKHTGDLSNRQLECEICQKRWPSKTALERHMNVHGQKQPRNFMCSVCGNAFYSNYHLKSHMLRHTKENNFKCTEPGCNAAFRADGSRKKHFYNFHFPDEQKPFTCDICQKRFFRKAYLADHLRKHGKAAELMLPLYRQKITE